ncbi:hypothetical protein FKM82_001703 [Ascaphus truei]
MKSPRHSFACSCCILLISICVTGTHSFATLIQMSKSPLSLVRNNTEITCTMKGHFIQQMGVFWYRQTNKSADMQFIMSATVMKSSYGSGFSTERFSASRDTFQNTFTLKISYLEPSDSGIYYCMVEKAAKIIFGNGTILHVVHSLPSMEKTTQQMPPCKCRLQTQAPTHFTPGVACSAAVWAPLVGCALILLISLAVCILHTRRIYRRSRHHFRKQ